MAGFVVNGRDVVVDAETTPLVFVLRNDLGLYGVRTGCGIGECGACVVLVDGRAARSCQLQVSAVEGAQVTTPEGLGTPEAPHPIQQAFLDEQAAQCGYCVNGMVMSVAGLLAVDPAPDEAAIQAALAEHLCRCGTNHRILRAVRRLAGQEVPPPEQVRRAGPAPPADAAPERAEAVLERAVAEPDALRRAPNVEQWLRPLPDGRIEVLSGRVELGQGVRTALAQVVAAGLGVSVERIVVRSAATDATPDEGYTAGSMSLEQGGVALARAAAAFRRLSGTGRPPVGPIEQQDSPQWTSVPPLGEPVHRDDLLPKLTGAPAYVHDLTMPDMLHARALLPPTHDTLLITLDTTDAEATIVHDGRLVIAIAEREEQAIRAVGRLARSARWSTPDSELDTGSVWHPVVEDPGHIVPTRRATYTKPYEAHASIAPSCAVALADPNGLTVWTHSQGVFPLRRELAALLNEDEHRLTVCHVDGPGCYGHNGADDAAGFAVLAARAVPGRPVRFQFSVRDEFAWEPYGPQMRADVEAALGDDGRITAWRSHLRTGAHTSRPHGSGDRLAAAWLRAGGPARPWAGAGEGGVRNAVPIYDIPVRQIGAEYTPTRHRTSALRSLGAYLNVFAIESFMDELAEAAGKDPVDFRRAHLRDDRARAVLRTAAETAGWQPHTGPSGRGRGIALARYKGSKAYVAQVVDVQVDTVSGAITVHRVLTVCDAGTIVNPDGLRNQLEGGTLQGLSRALHERAPARDWTDYPVLRFAEVPRLDTVLLDRPGLPPLGAGEAATPVTPAALANAVDDAVGIRVRTLPLTPDRLRVRLEEMDAGELARVRA